MQPLSAPISDSLYLAHLCNLEFDHYPMKLSDNLNNSLPLDGGGLGWGCPPPLYPLPPGEGKASCRIVFPVYFREKEMQNQRHEVCLKFIGLEYWKKIGVME
jgi:hypothetical protein